MEFKTIIFIKVIIEILYHLLWFKNMAKLIPISNNGLNCKGLEVVETTSIWSALRPDMHPWDLLTVELEKCRLSMETEKWVRGEEIGHAPLDRSQATQSRGCCTLNASYIQEGKRIGRRNKPGWKLTKHQREIEQQSTDGIGK